jgi:predicted membrane protein
MSSVTKEINELFYERCTAFIHVVGGDLKSVLWRILSPPSIPDQLL